MDARPRSEALRLAAAAAYLPLVAFGLLARRKLREDRLVRFHAYQAIALQGIGIGGLAAISIVSTFASGWGLLLDALIGIGFLVVMATPTAIAFYGAVMAYQGQDTGVPILTDWVWARVNGQPPPPPPDRPRRKRRRQEGGNLDLELPPIPPPPPAPRDEEP